MKILQWLSRVVAAIWQRGPLWILAAIAVLTFVVALSIVRSCTGGKGGGDGDGLKPVASGENVVPPVLGPPIASSDVPVEHGGKNAAGVLHVAVTDTGETGTVHRHEFDVVVPKEPEKHSPVVVAPHDSGDHVGITATYQEVRPPLFAFAIIPHLGASGSREGVSPYGSVTVLSVAEKFYLTAVGIDKFGLGPGAQYEFYDRLEAGARWNVLKFGGTTSDAAFTLTYRILGP